MYERINFLQKYLDDTIPITTKIGLRVKSYDGKSLKISAPLSKNKNDKNIAFAGSIYSIAALAGWGLLTLKLNDEDIDAKVVIHTGNITYYQPITGDFEATCTIETPHDWEKLKNRVEKKGNGTISLTTKLSNETQNNESRAILDAEYYAYLNKHDLKDIND